MKRHAWSPSLGSLLWRAAVLKRKQLLGWLLAFLLIGLLQLLDCSSCSRERFATFNIENFPKSERQVEGAFAAIRETSASAVGVQEITDPEAFERGARRHLGPSWSFVHIVR